jgi:hypothetical protein
MGREFDCKIKVELPDSATSGDAVTIKNLTISCLQHGLAGILLLEPTDEALVADAAALFRGRYSDRLPDVKWSELVTTITVGTALAFGVYPSLEAADLTIVAKAYSLELAFWARGSIPAEWLDYVIFRFPHWHCRLDYVEYESCEGYIEYRDGKVTRKSADFPQSGEPLRLANLAIET